MQFWTNLISWNALVLIKPFILKSSTLARNVYIPQLIFVYFN